MRIYFLLAYFEDKTPLFSCVDTVKIGVSKNPQSRYGSIRTACPQPLRLLFDFKPTEKMAKILGIPFDDKTAKKVEALLHLRFHQSRVRDRCEWFKAYREQRTSEKMSPRPGILCFVRKWYDLIENPGCRFRDNEQVAEEVARFLTEPFHCEIIVDKREGDKWVYAPSKLLVSYQSPERDRKYSPRVFKLPAYVGTHSSRYEYFVHRDGPKRRKYQLFWPK